MKCDSKVLMKYKKEEAEFKLKTASFFKVILENKFIEIMIDK